MRPSRTSHSSPGLSRFLVVVLLSACVAPTAAPSPALPSPVVVGAATTTPAPVAAGATTLQIPFPPDVPPDAEIDTASIREGITASGILSAYPGLELVDVATAPGYIVLTFNQPVPVAACHEIFAMFQATPVCAGAAISASPGVPGVAPGTPSVAPPFAPGAAPTVLIPPTPDADAATAAAQRVLPSVVYIAVTSAQKAGVGNGTGFFISPDGYIVTNAHVIVDGTTFEVTLYDGRKFPARLVGLVESQQPDIGILKVEATGFPAVEFGDSSAIQYGEPLMLIGHPTGYGYWMVTGGKYVGSETGGAPGGPLVSTVRADMPGAPGTSGGPMINQRGQVVGVIYAGDPGQFAELEIKPGELDILWTWAEFHSRKLPPITQAVAISDTQTAAEEILARQGNIPAPVLPTPVYATEGSRLIIPTSSDVPVHPSEREHINALLGAYPGYTLVDMTAEPGQLVLTFNQPLPEAALSEVLQSLSGRVAESAEVLEFITPPAPTPVLATAAPVPTPTGTPPPDEPAALAAAQKVSPSVVSVFGQGASAVGGATGFIISPDGYILTNSHFANDPDFTSFEVTLYDGRKFPARLVGYDEDENPDVGVLKVEAAGLPAVEIGDPAALRPGETLLAIGHPGSYGYWLVSAGKFRQLSAKSGYADLDAENLPVSSGNSGGPIINLNGQVVALLWGSPGGETPPVAPAPFRVIWTWLEFDLLSTTDTTSGVAIGDALAAANQIITQQGNVP